MGRWITHLKYKWMKFKKWIKYKFTKKSKTDLKTIITFDEAGLWLKDEEFKKN